MRTRFPSQSPSHYFLFGSFFCWNPDISFVFVQAIPRSVQIQLTFFYPACLFLIFILLFSLNFNAYLACQVIYLKRNIRKIKAAFMPTSYANFLSHRQSIHITHLNTFLQHIFQLSILFDSVSFKFLSISQIHCVLHIFGTHLQQHIVRDANLMAVLQRKLKITKTKA